MAFLLLQECSENLNGQGHCQPPLVLQNLFLSVSVMLAYELVSLLIHKGLDTYLFRLAVEPAFDSSVLVFFVPELELEMTGPESTDIWLA